MAYTYPLRAPFNATGIPWGDRSTATGTPLTIPVTTNDSTVMSLAAVTDVAIYCKLISGTSCVVVPWFYDSLAGVWVAQTPVTVDVDKVIQLAVPAIRYLFVEQNTFVGAAHVEVYCVGNSTHPGAQ